MRRALQVGLVVAFAFAFVPAYGQNPDLIENFCTGELAPAGPCSTDNLFIEFDESGSNELELAAFEMGRAIPCKVFMETTSASVQGWSYAIAHDEAMLNIDDSDAQPGPPFVPSVNLNSTGTDAAAKFGTVFEQNKVVSGGLISAIVLDLLGGSVMEVKRNSILNMNYTLQGDPGTGGTILRFVDGQLGVEGSPPVDLNVTNAGVALLPRELHHGQVSIMGGPEPMGCPEGTADNGLYFGDVGDDHTVEGASVAIVSRNDADLLGFSFGVKTEVAGGNQTWTFSGDLGNNDVDGNPVPVELNFTKSDGSAVEPAAGNGASAATTDPVNGVVRGAALTAFEGDDFFAVDLAPEIGGPGFFVGYVASLSGNINSVIPTTPSPDDSCPSNELVVASVGEITDVAFKRGDANGDGKIAVTDGVQIIQIAAGNLQPVVDCTAARDANGDGTADISDGVFLLNYIFRKNSPVPPAPFPACEPLPGADCAVSTCP